MQLGDGVKISLSRDDSISSEYSSFVKKAEDLLLDFIGII